MSVGVWSLQLGVDVLFVHQPGWTTPRTGSVLRAGAIGEGALNSPTVVKFPQENTSDGN